MFSLFLVTVNLCLVFDNWIQLYSLIIDKIRKMDLLTPTLQVYNLLLESQPVYSFLVEMGTNLYFSVYVQI